MKIDLRAEPFPCDESMLELFAAGHVLSSVLFTAVELSIFDHLESAPADSASLAAKLELSRVGLDRLLVALTALGLLRRDEDRLYHNRPLASGALTSGSPRSIVPMLLQHQRHMVDLFHHLGDAVRTGEAQFAHWSFADSPAAPDCYSELARHPDEFALLLSAMNRASQGVGRALTRQVDFTSVHHLIDLGGGGGQVAIELAGLMPHLSIAIVDLPPACRYAQARIEAAGLIDRIRCIPADLRGDLRQFVAPAEAVLLSGVIGDWPAAERAAILRNAAAVVAPGGQLLISETLFNDERTGPVMTALLSLFMLVGTRGDNFTAAELSRMLAEAGLPDVEVFRNGAEGLRDLVVARR